MKQWFWDRKRRLYVDRSGDRLTDKEIREALDEYIESTQDAIAKQVAKYTAGSIGITALFIALEEEITALHGASGSVAYGGLSQMDMAKWDRINERLQPELHYLSRFQLDIAQAANLMAPGEALSAEAITSRAQLYPEAAYSQYMNQVVQRETDDGVTLGRRICEADGASCDECVEAATEEFIPLEDIPEIGSLQCMCITTSDSRVLTDRGWIAIATVVPGDKVLTHLGRWQQVVSVSVKLSNPSHRFVSVSSPSGAWVGFTDDHKLFAQDAWRPIYNIMQQKLSVYNWGNEQLQRIRQDLCLREGERLPSERMPVVRYEPESQVAMGYEAGGNHGGDYQRSAASAHSVRGFNVGVQMAAEARRPPILDMALGRRSQARDLSLSMGMAQGSRPDSSGLCSSPQERRPDMRSPVEPRTKDRFQTQDRTPDGQLPHASTQRAVPDLRHDLPLEAAFTYETPKILQREVRQTPVFLWDLEVAYDHSFIVEGIVAHNSNCRCEFEFDVSGTQFAVSELFSGVVGGQDEYGGSVEVN